MAQEDDFSFPTTTDTLPRFIESPPLWRPNSFAASTPNTPERNIQDDGDHDYCCNFSASQRVNSMSRRKSFSYVECGTKTRRGGAPDDVEDDEEDEKMDMLWEDFNEEFSARNSKATTMADSDHMSPGRMLNIGCVQTLKLSKANKKPSTVVFMKVLRKIFLHHNSHRPLKKNHQW